MKRTRLFQALLLSGALVLPVTAQTSGTQSGQTSGSQAGQTSGSQSGSQSGQTSRSQSGQTSGSQSGQTTGSQSGQSGSRTSGQTGSSSHSGAGQHSGHMSGAAGSESRIGAVDQQFMTKAAHSGMMEVQLAKMAQEKAASDEVKQYARQLEQDHQKANEQLKQIAQQRGVDLPADMPKQHDQQMSKLQNLSGEQFDRAFMRQQVDHHKKDLKEFQRHANRSMDSAVKDFAQAQVPVLEGHLRQAQQLASSTGTRSRSGSTSMSTSGSSDSSSQGSTTSGHQGSGSKDKKNNQ